MNSTGKEIMTATVLGNEVAIRIGLAMMPSRKVTDTGVNAYTWHCYGSATASSKLLKLTEDQIIHTFGITGSNSPLPTTVTKMGRPLSYIKNNFQRMTDAGILGALLAQKGFLGLTKIMDSSAGFWKMSGSDRYDMNRVQYGLGKEYEILKIAFKPYPACRWIHSILDATHDIFQSHVINPREINEINVYTVSDMVKWFVDYEPNSLIDAEFSIPYTVAMIIYGVKPGLEWFNEKRLRDPEVLALAKKVRVYSNLQDDEAFYQSSANMANATVEIVKKDGEKIKKRKDLKHDHLRGSAKNPIDVKKKAKYCALSAGMKERQIEEIISMIDRLEEIDNISKLTELLNI
jgi:2-methylcitrate dehydratase PrpD